MEIFNIGPMELLLIVMIALIVLGPEEMVRTGRKLAKSVSKIIRSPVWKSLVNTSQEIRELPQKFIHEAELDETVEELNKMNKQFQDIAKTNPLEPPKKTSAAKSKTEKKTTPPDNVKGDEQPKPVEEVVPPMSGEPAGKEKQPDPEKLENPSENAHEAGSAQQDG
ncbi:MAG: hypothetical protein LLG42_02880 [Chloroflexi bacterium]|nr:hypothetical protein [Chloroflexota bacterium]